jgi:hypothetical protein
MYRISKSFLKKIPFHSFKKPFFSQTTSPNYRVNGIVYSENNYIYKSSGKRKIKIQPVKNNVKYYDENIAAQIGFIP